MVVKVGTFNLNNLFSRFNFEAEIGAAPGENPGGLTLTFEAGQFKVRTFQGRLVKGKSPEATALIAQRIADVVRADVLAVQEVEHIEILKEFNRDHLNGMYPNIVLVEGNDERLIDVGIMSKLPIGPITSHQTAVHPEDPTHRVFSRDLLQVEILNAAGKNLFTLYNTHLKSHFVPFGEDADEGAVAADQRRRRQAETIKRIIGRTERKDSRFVLVGDMNDPPDSPQLASMLEIDGQPLVNTLANPEETRPAPPEAPGQGPGPQTKAWTDRFNPPGAPLPEYRLFDHIWVSQALAGRFGRPKIDRRTKLTGDGSDHDPAWIELEL